MMALCIFAYAGSTDLLDSFIGRSFKIQTSVLGSIIDLLTDKLLVCTLFVTLTYVDLHLSLMLLVLTRNVAFIARVFYFKYRSLSSHQKSLRKVLDVRKIQSCQVPCHTHQQLQYSGTTHSSRSHTSFSFIQPHRPLMLRTPLGFNRYYYKIFGIT